MEIIKKHQNVKYIINRLKQICYFKMNPDHPWMTKKSIELLDHLITKKDLILEFGSGRSTKWFAERCNMIISVENNTEWFRKVKDQIMEFNNIEYIFASINKQNPVHSEYLSILSKIPDNSIDFIINDGKIRDLVAYKSIDKLKPGGIYLLDNAERYLPNDFDLPESMGSNDVSNNYWASFSKITTSWRRIWTTDGVSSTLLLFKS